MRAAFLPSLLLPILAMTVRSTDSTPPTADSPQGDPTPGRQVECSLTVGERSIPYLCYLPEDYAKSDTKVPLVLFLHGRGESNGPLSRVASWGPAKYLAAGEQMPYVVLSPQCPKESWWSNDDQQQLLLALLDHAAATWRIDLDRVYVTGLSMGGYGTWRLCADHPTRFAAALPICGAGDPAWGDKLKDLPIWTWHGTDDQAVPYAKSVEMVEAIRKAGGENVRFTTLEHIGHNSWEAAYRTPEVWRWLEKQRRQEAKR